MIQTAFEMLKDGGHLVVATGSRILVPFKKPLSEYLSKNPADTHSFRFSANALSNILGKNKFGKVRLNRFVDGDFLCAIGEKSSTASAFKLQKDDPNLIVDFFNRWHLDTQWFVENKLI